MTGAIYVIHWSSPRYRGTTIPEGSGEANAVRYIVGGHVGEGVSGVSIERVDAYDTDESWARECTEDIARAVARHAAEEGEISRDLHDFVAEHCPGAERGIKIADRTFAAA